MDVTVEARPKVEFALDYARRGYRVFPCHWIYPDGKCSCRHDCGSPGKHPIEKGWQESATTDEVKIRWLWKSNPDANIGVACGKDSNLTVLDVDGDVGRDTLHDLEMEHGELPVAPLAITGRGGNHYYFKFEASLANAVRFAPGLDIRTEGGLVIGVGSQTTGPYLWDANFTLDDKLMPPQMPEWLIRKVHETQVSKNGAPRLPDQVVEGDGRNNELYRVGRSLKAKNLPAAAIRAGMLAANQSVCKPPMESGEINKLIENVIQQPDSAAFKAARDETPEPGAPEKPDDDRPFPVLDPAALHGIAGEYVEKVDPYTEADRVAVLITFLVCFGNVCGRGIYKIVDGLVRHYMCLWAVLVGDTGKSRKGTSAYVGRRPIVMMEPEWLRTCWCSGIGSGEGIIARIHDPVEGRDENGNPTIIHPGISDKRLMLFEEELAGLLQVSQRHGNLASMILRQGWAGVTLQNTVKNSPLIATDPHMSTLAHITREELLRNIGPTEAANGFGNRFGWYAVRRSKELPESGYLGEEHLSKLVQTLIKARDLARRDERMEWSPAAREKWISGYSWLSRSRKGLMGAMLSRAEAQVTRLALTYAALDGAPSIGLEHLDAALALWKYSEDSAWWIFGNAIGDPTADTILLALRRTPGGMTRTDIRNLFSRNLSQEKIELALRLLLTSGLVRPTKEETGGRPTERWMATK